jgi:nucleoside-diphosphate-sugar epimerase
MKSCEIVAYLLLNENLMTKTLIIGCGDLGLRIALRLRKRGDAVVALVRSSASAARLAALGLDVLQHDLDQLNAPINVAGMHILYLAPPSSSGKTDQRMTHFLHAMHGQPHHFVYLSTTGVYGDCGGAWIDETAPLQPKADRAWRRVDAEAQVRRAAAAQSWHYNIVRVPGIYGPNRLPLARLRSGEPLLRADQAPFTNRIHVDDLAKIFVAVLEQARSDEIYNACDGHPGNMTAYFHAVADAAGIARAPEIDLATAHQQLSPGLLSYLEESRRLSNTKLLTDLGITLDYPTLAEGLAAIFAAANTQD